MRVSYLHREVHEGSDFINVLVGGRIYRKTFSEACRALDCAIILK